MSGIPKMPSQIQVLSGVDRAKEANRTREMKGTEKGSQEKEKWRGDEKQTKKRLYKTGWKAKK